MAEGSRISRAELALPEGDDQPPAEETLDLRAVRDKAERSTVLTALARTNGNVVKASELLCISRPTLYDLINRLGIRLER